MSDPFKGQPSNHQPAQPQSKPIKLAPYPATKGAHQIKVEDGDGSSRLPKK